MQNNLNNDRFVQLLNNWGERQSNINYNEVLKEIQTGHTYLLLPSNNGNQIDSDWTSSQESSALKLTSILELDGERVLAAFSDEEALSNWANKDVEYTAMSTLDILDLCNREQILRLVINPNLPSTFVLANERNRRPAPQDEISIGTAQYPLSKFVIEELQKTFANLPFVAKAYQYGLVKNGEFANAIGLIMAEDNEDIRFILQNQINETLAGETLEHPLEIMILETAAWQKDVQQINGALFYSKS